MASVVYDIFAVETADDKILRTILYFRKGIVISTWVWESLLRDKQKESCLSSQRYSLPFKSLVVGCLHFQGKKEQKEKEKTFFFKGSPDVGGAGKNFWANFGSMFSASQSSGGGSQQGF